MDLRKLYGFMAVDRPLIFEHHARWKNGGIVLPPRRITLRVPATETDSFIRCRPIKLKASVLQTLDRLSGLPRPYQIFVYDTSSKKAAIKSNRVVYTAGQLRTQVYPAVNV